MNYNKEKMNSLPVFSDFEKETAINVNNFSKGKPIIALGTQILITLDKMVKYGILTKIDKKKHWMYGGVKVKKV